MTDSGPSLLVQACSSVASMKGIQTLDLSGNQLSVAGATELAKALCRCRSLHEIVLEESVDVSEAPEVSVLMLSRRFVNTWKNKHQTPNTCCAFLLRLSLYMYMHV